MADDALETSDSEKALAPLRERIDELDAKIVNLLNERAGVVIEIGKLKRDGDWAIYAPDRERKVLDRVRRLNAGPLPDSCLEAIWRELMSVRLAVERPLRIGYLGSAGSFTHVAARRKFGASVEYDALDRIAAIFNEVTRGHIGLGLVPIENSAIGRIGEALDSLLDAPVRVCAEELLGVHHNVLANGPVEKIKRVYSNPEVFSQCRQWLSVQLQDAERVPAASSSKAAEMASQEEDAAAIGSALAAELYGLKVIFENIEDHPNNITRFLVIARESAKPSGDDKTAITFTTAHKAHALASVLDVFGQHGINLTQIDKRPSQRVNWEYVFFIDCAGHETDEKMVAAIEEARTHCLQLTVLGSFPRAREVV